MGVAQRVLEIYENIKIHLKESKLPENFTVTCYFDSLMLARMSVSKIVTILSHVNAAVESGFSIISDIWCNGLVVRWLDSQLGVPGSKSLGGS